ncbi:GNAT family N-acetyltransferase [Aquimarina latercula]|uniref:GNAT family N-acetyltransferase n=1 Tax=Aquimarina latercula TaxID=987 RepID=UPI000424126E|nr:GNAT family N-acetyltransferase [Aquimarina latercula]
MAEVYLETNRDQSIEELVQLASTYYDSGDIVNEKYLNWQYNTNPFGKPYMTIAREDDKNEMVGQYLVIPLEYSINGKIEKGTLSLNTLTRGDYRGKGLFTKTALKTYEECANDNAKLTVGFPNQQSYPGFVKKLGFKYMGDIPLLIKPLKPINLFLNKLFKKKEKHGGEILLKIEESSFVKELSFENDKEKYTEFWESYKKDKKVILNKSIEFLKWRYVNIPTRNYKIFKIENEDKIDAIIIFRGENTLGSRTAIIMDYMALDNDGTELLKYILKELKKNNIEMSAVLSMPHTKENSLFKQKGFYKVPKKILPQPIPYIVRQNIENKESSDIMELDNWHIGFGDYDVF